jgi:L-seryl-tRNA(Ser) seleniumtransferase
VYTDLGGSIISDAIWADLTELNRHFVRMPDLLDATGGMIAGFVRAEAARVTPGASAAIALSVAATMTGDDEAKWEQLPDTAGMRNEVIMFRNHLAHFKYARCVRLPGAKIVPVGEPGSANPDDIAHAASDRSACVFVPQHLVDWYASPHNLERIIETSHRLHLPVVVDAAYLNYPIDLMRSFTRAGADLVCFSAKYFQGPNAGGFVAGRKDLIATVRGLDFTRFREGRRAFGRAFKMGRYEVAAVALALKHWMEMDHGQRFALYERQAANLTRQLSDIEGLSIERAHFTMDERLEATPTNCVVLKTGGHRYATVAKLASALEAGDPAIVTFVTGDSMVIVFDCLLADEEEAIARRIRNCLAAERIS